MELPLSRAISDSEKQGVFRYTKGFPMDKTIKGVFSFSFYHHKETLLESSIYFEGMAMYEQAILHKDSVFTGWRIVVYMDSFTYEALQAAKKESVLNNPLVECVIVQWPYYNTMVGKINGDVLRCMRLRAFFDFPTVPVFVRDADTIFNEVIRNALTGYSTGERVFSHDTDTVYAWEAAYYEGAKRHPNTFFFGTSLGYQRNWHENEMTKRKAPLGAFAGLQSSMPVVPCFTNESLWDEAMGYILQRSVRFEEIAKENDEDWIKTGNGATVKREVKKGETVIKFSNEHAKNRVGKDEQILLFVFLPKCMANTFFFELDMGKVRQPSLDYRHQRYPKKIFNKGSNTNLGEIFQKYIEEAISEDKIQSMKERIKTKNEEKKTQKLKALETYIKGKKVENLNTTIKVPSKSYNPIVTLGKLTFNFGPVAPPPSPLKVDPILPIGLERIFKAIHPNYPRDPFYNKGNVLPIDTLYKNLKEKQDKKNEFKQELESLFLLNEYEKREELLEKYKEAAEIYNEAVRAFLSYVKKIDTYDKIVLSRTKIRNQIDPTIQAILDWMKSEQAQIPPKQEGGTRRRNNKKKRSKTRRLI